MDRAGARPSIIIHACEQQGQDWGGRDGYDGVTRAGTAKKGPDRLQYGDRTGLQQYG